MNPDNERIQYLVNTSFLRNFPIDDFLKNNHYEIDLTLFICYCVGIINGKRYVHPIQMLSKTPSPGITSYEIKWWNAASTCRDTTLPNENEYDSFSFWSHSGVALRKHFFLFEDRMSLIRSTFIYDSITDRYYRLCSLLHYLYIPIVSPTGKSIFTSLTKNYSYQKVAKSKSNETNRKQKEDVRKYLKKFVKQFNHYNFLDKEYPRLFEEIIKITDTNKHGNTYM
jgi:hypothetical protein